jgi:aminoglycoside phosphotransferase family enzyme
MIKRDYQANLNLRPKVLLSDEIERKDWLALSWLYPTDFSFSKLTTTKQFLVAEGKTSIYRFANQEPGEGVASLQWQSICEEFAEHRLFAPGLYIGVRALQWIDGEPIWMPPTIITNPLATKPPSGADEFVVVIGKVETARLASKVFEVRRTGEEQKVSRLVRRLHLVHEMRKPRDPDGIALHAQRASVAVRRSVGEQLEMMVADYASALDSMSSLILQESKAFVRAFYENHQRELLRRLDKGCLSELHNGLRFNRIAFQSYSEHGNESSPIFFGRTLKSDTERFGDFLFDIADLNLEFHLMGRDDLSVLMISEVERIFNVTFDTELLRFFSVLRALERVSDSLIKGQHEESLTDYLGLSFRFSRNHRGPLMILLSGDHAEREPLAETLTELLSAETMKIEESESGELNASLIERHAQDARIAFLRGKSFVASRRSLSPLLSNVLIEQAELMGVEAIHVDVSSEIKRSDTQLVGKGDYIYSEYLSTRTVEPLKIDPVLSRAEMSLFVLNSI